MTKNVIVQHPLLADRGAGVAVYVKSWIGSSLLSMA